MVELNNNPTMEADPVEEAIQEAEAIREAMVTEAEARLQHKAEVAKRLADLLKEWEAIIREEIQGKANDLQACIGLQKIFNAFSQE